MDESTTTYTTCEEDVVVMDKTMRHPQCNDQHVAKARGKRSPGRRGRDDVRDEMENEGGSRGLGKENGPATPEDDAPSIQVSSSWQDR